MISSQSPATTREVMQSTVEALGRRLVGLRNLAIAVGMIILVAMVVAVALRSWRPLLGLLSVVPLSGVFWCRDTTRVGRWQELILGLWSEDRLDLDVLAETLSSTPGLPHPLLRGMLDALPTRRKGFPRMASDLRKATALTIQAVNRCQWDRTALATLAYSVALASLAWAGLTWSFRPMLGLLLAPSLLGLFPISTHLRLRDWCRRLAPLLQQGLDRSDFIQVTRQLDWGPISARKKERALEALIKQPA